MDIKIQSSRVEYGTKGDQVNGKKADIKDTKAPKEAVNSSHDKDEYIPSQVEKDLVYGKPSNKLSAGEIDRLIDESNKSYEQLKLLVQKLLGRQALTSNDLKNQQFVKIDDETRLEAQAAIGEGGPLSAENVSNNIVDFAIALSGGDKAKLEGLKAAIEKGFKEAARILGGTLPDISNKTYDLVMDKLNKWAEEE